jgi:DNA anti-recombination protein RmuC
MERALWTDERIDDMVDRIEKRFDQVDRRFDAMERRFERIENELVSMRRDMHMGFMIHTSALLGLTGVLLAHSL